MHRLTLSRLMLGLGLVAALAIGLAVAAEDDSGSAEVTGAATTTTATDGTPTSSTPGTSGDDAAASTTSAPPSTTSEDETATSTTAVPRTLTMAFTGDVIPHGGVVRQAAANAGGSGYDFTPMFAEVEPHISGVDLAICHLETPLSLTNTEISGYPLFNAPHQLADGLAAVGYDGCSTASNHSLDRGVDGVTSTVVGMGDAGLGQAGMARSAQEAATPALYDVDDVTVGHLSYTYGLNGFALPAGEPWRVNLIDPAEIVADVGTAREAGAELVVVSLHWGAEYVTDPIVEQTQVAAEITAAADIDLVVGHHAHVVQPVDVVNGTPVVYGLGNFLSNQSAACCVTASQDGVIVEATATERSPGEFDVSLRYVPTWVDRSDYTIVPTPGATAPELVASRDRTVATVTSRGAAVEMITGAPGG